MIDQRLIAVGAIVLVVFLVSSGSDFNLLADIGGIGSDRVELDVCNTVEECNTFFAGVGLSEREIQGLDIKCGGNVCTQKAN